MHHKLCVLKDDERAGRRPVTIQVLLCSMEFVHSDEVEAERDVLPALIVGEQVRGGEVFAVLVGGCGSLATLFVSWTGLDWTGRVLDKCRRSQRDPSCDDFASKLPNLRGRAPINGRGRAAEANVGVVKMRRASERCFMDGAMGRRRWHWACSVGRWSKKLQMKKSRRARGPRKSVASVDSFSSNELKNCFKHCPRH